MKILFLILISVPCLAQSKNDSTIFIPPTLEARIIAAEQALTKAREEAKRAQQEIDDGIKMLFEFDKKKQEEFDIVGYSPGVLRIKRKPVNKK